MPLIWYVESPAIKSLSPVTVTFWGTFQFAALKTRDDCESEPSLGVVLVKLTVTGLDGWLVRTTAKEAVAPAFEVCKAVDAAVTLATSASVLVTVTGIIARPL